MKRVGIIPVVCLVVACTGLVASALVQQSEAPPKPRYDEPNVVSYPLPDAMARPDGTTIETADEWRNQQRSRILRLFETEVFGRRIGSPDGVRFKLAGSDPRAMDGKATLKQVTVSIAKGDRTLEFPLVLFVPNAARKPVSLFLLINNRGSENTDPTRKVKSEFWPAEQVIARGYAIAAFQVGDIDPDKHDGFKNGIHGLLESGDRPDDAWGTLAAWGWGASWAMDYFETDPDIDRHRVAVVGHSRGGKTALWAAARDERFAIAGSNCSGCGGAALSKRIFGETVEAINRAFPHWFCKNFTKYNNREEQLPFDQHMLLALIAPRALYVVSAEEDVWADPKGEYLSLFHAGPVYRLFGLPAIPEQMPALDSPVIAGRVGYHIRTGRHNLTLYDWMRYLDFADSVYKDWDARGGAEGAKDAQRRAARPRNHDRYADLPGHDVPHIHNRDGASRGRL